ncbi:MAG: hypothetical protein COW12_04490, partial [Candidatus Omnitrophica bacterium CG12_big_fil_rev_8_21_14_0_65_45_16]
MFFADRQFFVCRLRAAILVVFLLVVLPQAFAKVKTSDLLPSTSEQPYPHQTFETKRQNNVKVTGQAYRARPDLMVLELRVDQTKRLGPPPSRTRPGARRAVSDEPAEIQSVRLKTPDGKVREANMRRVPEWFMPQARQNFNRPL